MPLTKTVSTEQNKSLHDKNFKTILQNTSSSVDFGDASLTTAQSLRNKTASNNKLPSLAKTQTVVEQNESLQTRFLQRGCPKMLKQVDKRKEEEFLCFANSKVQLRSGRYQDSVFSVVNSNSETMKTVDTDMVPKKSEESSHFSSK